MPDNALLCAFSEGSYCCRRRVLPSSEGYASGGWGSRPFFLMGERGDAFSRSCISSGPAAAGRPSGRRTVWVRIRQICLLRRLKKKRKKKKVCPCLRLNGTRNLSTGSNSEFILHDIRLLTHLSLAERSSLVCRSPGVTICRISVFSCSFAAIQAVASNGPPRLSSQTARRPAFAVHYRQGHEPSLRYRSTVRSMHRRCGRESL